MAIAVGTFVWGVFVSVPPPIPWMMGETALVRILAVNVVAIVGALVVSALVVIPRGRPDPAWVGWLGLPCGIYLAVVAIRVCLGLPLSIG